MKYHVVQVSDPGLKRKGANQDSVGAFTGNWFARRPPLLVLADGMGGHAGGEIASRLVVQSFLDCYKGYRGQDYDQVLQMGVEEAHQRLRVQAKKNPELATMGSTVVAAILTPGLLYLLNVGDSRGYLMRGDALMQLSCDQSMVAEMVRRGVISSAEASRHPQRNQLSMSLSPRRDVIQPFQMRAPLQPGDRVLLCSDGLWAIVPDDQILYYISNFSPQEALHDLVKQAHEYGGPDNISIILAQQIEQPGKV